MVLFSLEPMEDNHFGGELVFSNFLEEDYSDAADLTVTFNN